MHIYEIGYNPSATTLTIGLPIPFWEQIIDSLNPLPPIFCDIESQMPRLECVGNCFGFGPELQVSRDEVGTTLSIETGKNVSARTVASMWAAFWMADYLAGNWTNFLPPLIAIGLAPDSYGIRATIAPELAIWLSSCDLATVPDLMKEVQTRIFGHAADLSNRIAEVRDDGALRLACNSDCCCLGAGHGASLMKGYELSSHNCVSISDLFTFMCALAYIEDRYRHEQMVSSR